MLGSVCSLSLKQGIASFSILQLCVSFLKSSERKKAIYITPTVRLKVNYAHVFKDLTLKQKHSLIFNFVMKKKIFEQEKYFLKRNSTEFC